MRAALKRLDDWLATGEAALAAILLLGMILAASGQALLRNLTNAGVEWANRGLASIDWVDPFLQSGTLWLAFLGASLAAHADRHLAIDILPRIAPPRGRALMRGLAFVASGITCFFLARVFLDAVLNLGAVRTLEFEVLTEGGAVHVCEASRAALGDSGLGRPELFCAIRSALVASGLGVETPGSALQLVTPFGFSIVGLRLLARGIGELVDAARNDVKEATPPVVGGQTP